MHLASFKRFELLVSFGCMVMLGYFAFYAFYGVRGYPYRDQLDVQFASLTNDFDSISAQRKAIESRVALLRPESVDPDLLDELARSNLDMANQNDIVVKFSN
jgi:cell division protein FtsB